MGSTDWCQAHAHARKAARETQLNNWSEAADEHGRAAVDFARASRSIADPEVLTTSADVCDRELIIVQGVTGSETSRRATSSSGTSY